MKSTLHRTAAVLALAGSAWLTASAASEPTAAVEYTFRDLPLNSLGVKSLADLRGKPVVIDFWGKN